MGDDSILGKVISMFVTVLVGIVLLISGLLPIAVSQINSIANIEGISLGQASQYEMLFGLVIVLTILVLVVAVARYFTGGDKPR